MTQWPIRILCWRTSSQKLLLRDNSHSKFFYLDQYIIWADKLWSPWLALLKLGCKSHAKRLTCMGIFNEANGKGEVHWLCKKLKKIMSISAHFIWPFPIMRIFRSDACSCVNKKSEFSTLITLTKELSLSDHSICNFCYCLAPPPPHQYRRLRLIFPE